MSLEARTYQQFYTKSTPIVDYMINKLQLEASDHVFEPCGGDGVFIDAILNIDSEIKIDVCELNDTSFNSLVNKYANYSNIKIRKCDTLLDPELVLASRSGGIYDKVIANPPYGAWQDIEKRTLLRKLYPGLYAKESYTLFLFRCIELLKNGGILSFIIPDTFLNLHMHKAIREYILTHTKILEVSLFPSSFFPGVNFGYANLSIITLQKTSVRDECEANNFRVLTSFTNVNQLSSNDISKIKILTYDQRSILMNPEFAFYIVENQKILNVISNTTTKIGDIASCVTGFYSGNDKEFLYVNNHNVKNGKNYKLVKNELIERDCLRISNILDGITGAKHFIPIVKGGNVKYLKPECWFMNWSVDAVTHYKKDKKARFQNPKFYFKYGIGVPMISSSSITASLIENKLFDQSIVGVFPFDQSLTYYLLSFFNSSTCNKLIRTINPSANNPANYIKKIPFIEPSEEQRKSIELKITEIIESIRRTGSFNRELSQELDEIFISIYGF